MAVLKLFEGQLTWKLSFSCGNFGGLGYKPMDTTSFSWGHEYLKNFIGHAEKFVQFSLAI
jgi:hypothetical protein